MVPGGMVYTERAETAAVSCGTSHVSAVSTPLRWIFKKRAIKKLVTRVESHASALSLLENGEQRCIKAINKQTLQTVRASAIYSLLYIVVVVVVVVVITFP